MSDPVDSKESAQCSVLSAQSESAGRATKLFSEPLRAELQAYKEAHEYSLKDLARQLDYSEGTLSRYLSGKPEGDVEALEALIADALKTGQRRVSSLGMVLFETSVSQQFDRVCETIQKTNDFGLVHSPAGLGKTSAGKRWLGAHPTSLLCTAARWTANRQHRKGDTNGIEGLIFNALDTRAWKRTQRRAEFMVERLKGSNRLLMIDNAHRLSTGGLQWMFDFHDETECPVVLIGNPEVLDLIRASDQMYSRIGLCRELKLKDTAKAAEQMLRQYAPEHLEELRALATKVAGNQGHLRTLKKHLRLVPEILPAAKGDAVQAFLAAHQQLVTSYAL